MKPVTSSMNPWKDMAWTAAAALCMAVPLLASAQAPTGRDVMLVVPHAAGTGVDAVARGFSPALQKIFETGVVVENRVGANGAIGSVGVAKAKGDGSTLMLNASPPFVTFPFTQATPSYDAVKDFKPVARVGTVPMVLVVSADSGIKTFDQFLAYVKANPGKANYASPGSGSAGYLAMERLKALKSVQVQEVLYKSTPQSLVDVSGGHVLSAFSSVPAVAALVEAGKLRPLAIGSTRRMQQFPDVPTLAELTGDKQFLALVWYGFLAPAGTPPETVARLYGAISTAYGTEAVQQAMRSQGILPELQAPAEFERSLAAEYKAAATLLKPNP